MDSENGDKIPAAKLIADAKSQEQLKLDLSGQNLSEIPTEVLEMSWLKTLILDGNRLTRLPPEIGELTALERLELERNGLTALPQEIGKLHSLEYLNINHNSLVSLPKEIGNLSSLEELHLYENNLKKLPREIGQLASLTQLAVLENGLIDLPPEIGDLMLLRTLWAGDNHFTELPVELGKLLNLEGLFVENNMLRMLPTEIGGLTKLTHFATEGNPLPASFAAASSESANSLLSLLRSLNDPSKVDWVCEAKLMITGEGNVGKTSLRKALDDKSSPSETETTTWGVECGQFDLPHPEETDRSITLNYWDFGGQKIYRVTHQFFYSDQGLYLLVWDPRKGEEQCMLQDWLTRIAARTAGRAKVILVATHALDKGGSYSWKLDLDRMDGSLRKIVVDQISVDSVKQHNLEDLKRLITKHVRDLPGFDSPINIAWDRARNKALASENKAPWMTYESFEAICRKEGVDHPDAVKSIAATFVHRLGRGVWYGVDWPDDPYLRDTLVRDPTWLSMAFMELIEHEPTRASGGVLDHDQLEDAWRKHGREEDGWIAYKIDDFARLMRMLREQGVALPTRGSGGKRSLVPQLVPGARPNIPWDATLALPDEAKVLRMRTRLEPDVTGIFPSLVAALEPYHFYDPETGRGAFWTDGMFLRDVGGRYSNDALIEVRRERTCVWLDVTVTGEQPGFLLHQIDATITQVIAFWPGVQRTDEVLCPTRNHGHLCEGRFKLANIERWLKNGGSGQCQECDVEVEPEALIMGLTGRIRENSFRNAHDDILYLRNREERRAPRSVTVAPIEAQWKDIKNWQVMQRTRFKASIYSELSGLLVAETDFTGDPGLFKYVGPIAKLGSMFFGAPLPFELPVGVEGMLDEMSETLAKIGDYAPEAKQAKQDQPNLYLMREFLNGIGLDPEANGMDLAKAPDGKWYWMSQDELLRHKPQQAVLPHFVDT